ncbi:MAG TPA: peptidoglycan-binding domain-containing protein [Candidatus Dormibacteraeota bacterium]|nr:peptidoglycan-binding domain-containing protein [Candidatus Dormibacteraeota bacterium]
MRVRNAMLLALALLLIASGRGASATTTKANGTAKKKSAAAKSSGTAASSTSSSKGRRAKSKKTSHSRGRGQQAPTAERITEIQQALSKSGVYSGTPNGKWDSTTMEAVKKFQTSHGLNPSGKIDAKTLQQLGLGSQTAGIAAPLPPLRSSAEAVVSSQAARRQ